MAGICSLTAHGLIRPPRGNASVVLREAWRFERFAAWKASGRLDAVAAANTTFQPARVKQAWQLWNATCAQGRAVLTAAVVSPARRQANQSGAAVQW